MNTFIHSFKLDWSSISISEFCQTLERRIMLASANEMESSAFPSKSKSDHTVRKLCSSISCYSFLIKLLMSNGALAGKFYL